MPNELGMSLILNSLNKGYDQFVQNYNKHSMGKTKAKLHAMLKLTKKGIPKKVETPAILAIMGGKIQKDEKKLQGANGKEKGKSKLAYAPKTKIPPPPKRDNPVKDSICRYCKKEEEEAKNGDLNLYVGNGMRTAIKTIGSFDLILPNRLVIVLDNFHCAPSITKGVVSLSHLVDNGYKHSFMNYGISIMKDDVLYFNAIPCDGIYEIDMHNLYTNSFWGYALEFAARILNMVPTKKVHKTSLILQEASRNYTLHEAIRSDVGLELLQELDTQPLKDTREQHDEVKHKEVEPHSEKVPICRFERISQAPDMYGFYVNAEEHELRDLNEPPNYKVALSDLKSNK
ncbi:hypothetical protein Tco_0336996 [Tanacetum coccineum]